jgi:hypothetical protein
MEKGTLLLMRKAHRFLFDRKNGLVLQSVFRNFQAMKEYEHLVEQLRNKDASLILINHALTISALTALDAYKEEMKLINGCIQLQKQAFRRNWIWRMIVWPARLKFKERAIKVTKIQAVWRGFHVRRNFAERTQLDIKMRTARYRVVLQREIVPLQVGLKSFVAMRRYETMKQAVLAFEDRVITNVARERFLRIRTAARKIQRFYRGWTIRQIVALHKAAVVFMAERARLAYEHTRTVAPLFAKINAQSLSDVVSNDKKRSLILEFKLHRKFTFDITQVVADVLSGKFGNVINTVKQTKNKVFVYFSDTQHIVRIDLAKVGLIDVCVNPEIAETASKITGLEVTEDMLCILLSSGRLYFWSNKKSSLECMPIPKKVTVSLIAARHKTLVMVDIDGRAHVHFNGKLSTMFNLPGHAIRPFVTDEDAIVLLKSGNLFSLRTRSEIFPKSLSPQGLPDRSSAPLITYSFRKP